jgi:hypothetical protein
VTARVGWLAALWPLAQQQKCGAKKLCPGHGEDRINTTSVRRGTRVTKEYVGTGSLAELSAAEDAKRRIQRQVSAETWRQERAALEVLDRQFDTYWNAATELLKATLYAEGYYQHDRGEWRKRPPQRRR